MESYSIDTSPHLAPPGAGLPWAELQLSRLGLAFLIAIQNRKQTDQRLQVGQEAVLSLVASASITACSRQVLIRRLMGLEDSSRYWSVYMTLDHLRIVNDSVSAVIRQLLAGERPQGEASIAAVKPRDGVGSEVLPAFTDSCAELKRTVEAWPELHTTLRFSHPWFGPLDAAGWYFLAVFHLGLHYRQMTEILRLQARSSR